MTLLVISPDYASHALPLLSLAGAWQRRGQRVVVASGPAVAPLVREAGMEHVELVMSRGSNGGVVRAQDQSRDEARSLDAFFAATRQGMIETLRYQAIARATDLLWKPRGVALATIRTVEAVRPDAILVDHLAFGATIGLRAMQVRYADVVLGHPTALPIGDEVYGVPSAWPAAIAVPSVQLADLRAIATGVRDAFSVAYHRALGSLAPGSAPIEDAFALHGDPVLFVYAERLHDPRRTALLPPHAFLGSAGRQEPAPPDVAAWLAGPDARPLVVVSFGTFLSARTDVLARVVAALRRVDARVALATGASDRVALGPLPSDWLVRPVLPQVALLEHAQLLVTHGGNNSVTEALAAGVPLLAMPFSTDQFDGAAAVERNLAGLALDPNRAPRPLIAGAVRGLLRNPPPLPGRIGRILRTDPGPEIAYRTIQGLEGDPHGTLTPTAPSLVTASG